MNNKIQTLIRVANRTGYCDQTAKIAGEDYAYVNVELSGTRATPYQQRHSHVLTVTVHRRFHPIQTREFRDVALGDDLIINTDSLVALVAEACEAMCVDFSGLV